MRIATWNVNSIRSRVDRVEAWLQRSDIDVLAIQETKAKDEQFPFDRFTDLGYEVAHHGLNQWNGVAILSRVGLEDVQIGFDGDPGWGDPVAPEARSIGATCGGVRVWSLYIPNGRALDDPHMQYKLGWLAGLRQRATEWAAAGTPLALCGDWNIAPRDEDVWSVEYYADRERGFVDVVRPHAPGPETYTYWDYQRLAFPKRRGMRIDFVLGSASLAERVSGAAIDREERKGKGASDHAPVIVGLDGDDGAPGVIE